METFNPENSAYQILDRVGEGLTSVVYKAVKADSRGHSRQLVALKVLKDETAVPILRREFETLARVRSLHCARVLGWENDADRSALVLEWIEGATIDRLATRFELDSAEIDEIVRQIARGLLDLRSQGLHHGDLHPRNVIVDVEGRVRLVDFGTAPDPEPGVIRGVPAYLAPEIWDGRPTSFEADLFALGLVRRDVESRFDRIPSPSSARARAERMTNVDDDLLHPDPSRRKLPVRIVERDENAECVSSLARRVGEILAEKRAATQVIELERGPESKPWTMPIAASLAAAVCALSVPVRADAPVEIGAGTARLEVNSHRWLEIEINGRVAGFAPVSARLRVGNHRLRWRSSRGEGELRLEVSASRNLKLSETDLVRLSSRVNR